MPLYQYRARDASGKLVEGEMSADTKQAAINNLRSQKLLVTRVEEGQESVFVLPQFNLDDVFKPKVKTKDLAIFSRQFATMIDAGVPLLRSLNILTQQVGNKSLAKALSDVISQLERGNTLSGSMSQHPKVFPIMYTNMVEAGEVGGVLEEVLERMANHFEKEDELREKVKSALTYPGVIMVVALVAIVFMLTFVLPSFATMLVDMNVELPIITKVLMDISHSMQVYWYLHLGGVFIGIGGITAILKTSKGRFFWDRYSLRLPVYGNLRRKVIVSTFSRTLATLLRSGVPIISSLDVARKTSENMLMAASIYEAKNSIRDGQGISAPLKKSGIISDMALHMIAIGEETGELDTMLEKISFFFDREVDYSVSRLSSALEPILLVGIGIVIGGMVLSFMLPMVQIYGGF